MNVFGTILRRWRIRAALSQNALARASGVDPAYVNRIERAPDDATIMPSRRVVLGFAATLRCDAVDTDILLVAAGHCPEIIAQMPRERFRALYTLLGEDVAAPVQLTAVTS